MAELKKRTCIKLENFYFIHYNEYNNKNSSYTGYTYDIIICVFKCSRCNKIVVLTLLRVAYSSKETKMIIISSIKFI